MKGYLNIRVNLELSEAICVATRKTILLDIGPHFLLIAFADGCLLLNEKMLVAGMTLS